MNKAKLRKYCIYGFDQLDAKEITDLNLINE